MTRVNARLWTLVLALLGGCFTQGGDDSGGNGWGSGFGGHGGGNGFSCESDSACGGEVCARDGQCLPAAEVRTVHVTWTLSGAAPTTATCTNLNDLEITFYDGGQDGTFGFAPVPCLEGKFTVDKLPLTYTSVKHGARVRSGAQDDKRRSMAAAMPASLDLPY